MSRMEPSAALMGDSDIRDADERRITPSRLLPITRSRRMLPAALPVSSHSDFF